jgi:hypothetical protein
MVVKLATEFWEIFVKNFFLGERKLMGVGAIDF